MRPDTQDYRQLFLSGVPLLDTRAPVEFERGSFPGAENLPLMSDDEREQVGTCYKREGREAAIVLGESLVSGETRDRRIEKWCQFARENPQGYLYCFRGGLRSSIAQQWLHEAGIDYPRVLGGYKKMRQFLCESLARDVDRAGFVLISGRTGTGKTRVVSDVGRAIDLEGLARHRGSSFGRLPQGQPSQVDFEHALAIELMRLLDNSPAHSGELSVQHPIVVEDEGKLVGRIALPADLVEKMHHSPMLVVEESLEQRVDIIYQDYVIDLASRYGELSGVSGRRLHQDYLLDSLDRIRKRLGGELHDRIRRTMEVAFAAPPEKAGALHNQWIESLLVHYYDPMYDYLVGQREGEILARGTRQEMTVFARQVAQNP